MRRQRHRNLEFPRGPAGSQALGLQGSALEVPVESRVRLGALELWMARRAALPVRRE